MTPKSAGLDRKLAGEQQTLALPLRALLRNDPIVCRGEHVVRDVAVIMAKHGVGSVVVVDAASRPVGMFTNHDLVNAVARGLEARPVRSS